MHKNYRRKIKQDYPWDNRWKKVPDNRRFRAVERAAMQRLRAGDDPEDLVWPTKLHHGDDPWNYD